jgi:4'-phosphopantetheinyl transferase
MIRNLELFGKPLFDLSEGEVHLWFANPDEWEETALIASALATLETGEIARSERFHFSEHRKLFLVSHLLVRMALSYYADRLPAQWRFVRNDHGKPQVDPAMRASPPIFSLAHTAGVAVVGMTRAREIGVDVENRDRQVHARRLIERFFSPEEAVEMGNLPSAELRDRFFLTWTLKEAYIKGLGRGLAQPLDSFSFRLTGARPRRIDFSAAHPQDPEKWRFAIVEPRPRSVAALAVAYDPGTAVIMRCFQAVRLGEAAPLACVPSVFPIIALSAGVTCIKL